MRGEAQPRANQGDRYQRVPVQDAETKGGQEDQRQGAAGHLQPGRIWRGFGEAAVTDIWEPLQWQDDEVRRDVADGDPRELHRGFWAFVEAGWFQFIASVVVLFNAATVVWQLQHPKHRDVLQVPDQIILCFYIFELVCRVAHFKVRFLCGPRSVILWNALDVGVVAAGVLDQWLLSGMGEVSEDSVVRHLLDFLRLLQLIRVLKLIRIVREADLSWAEEPLFQSFVGGVILINSVIMGVETDVSWQGWPFIEQGLLLFYTFELAVRLKAQGWGFFVGADSGWNWLDFSIVTSSVFDTWLMPLVILVTKSQTNQSGSLGKFMIMIRLLRLTRILRLARLVRSVRPLFNLMMGLLAAMQGVAWVLVLTLVVLYAAGLMVTRLVGHGIVFGEGVDLREHQRVMWAFRSVPESMFLLFKLMNGAQSDDDALAIDELMTQVPMLKFAFVFFLITASWTLLSILTAVVSDCMIITTSKEDKLYQLALAEEHRQEHLSQLRDFFAELDVNSDGTIDPDELEVYFRNAEKAAQCARVCEVSCSDVLEVMRVLTRKSGVVDREQFIQCLTTVANPVTEKSMIRLEAILSDITNRDAETVTAAVARMEVRFSVLDRRSDETMQAVRKLQQESAATQQTLAKIQQLLASLDQKVTGTLDGVQELRAPRRARVEEAPPSPTLTPAAPPPRDRVGRMLGR